MRVLGGGQHPERLRRGRRDRVSPRVVFGSGGQRLRLVDRGGEQVEQPGHLQDPAHDRLRVADPHLASGPDCGVADGDEGADCGAIEEGNPGEVDLDDGGGLLAQHAEQPVAERRTCAGRRQPTSPWSTPSSGARSDTTTGSTRSLDRALAGPGSQWQPPTVRKPTKVTYDIHIAEGDKGRRLAPTQAQAILDVLTWTAEQQRLATEPAGAMPDTNSRPPSTNTDTLQTRPS